MATVSERAKAFKFYNLLPKWHVGIISIFAEKNFFSEHMRKMFIWPHHTTCGILVFKPGIEPKFSALEVQSLNY